MCTVPSQFYVYCRFTIYVHLSSQYLLHCSSTVLCGLSLHNFMFIVPSLCHVHCTFTYFVHCTFTILCCIGLSQFYGHISLYKFLSFIALSKICLFSILPNLCYANDLHKLFIYVNRCFPILLAACPVCMIFVKHSFLIICLPVECEGNEDDATLCTWHGGFSLQKSGKTMEYSSSVLCPWKYRQSSNKLAVRKKLKGGKQFNVYRAT